MDLSGGLAKSRSGDLNGRRGGGSVVLDADVDDDEAAAAFLRGKRKVGVSSFVVASITEHDWPRVFGSRDLATRH